MRIFKPASVDVPLVVFGGSSAEVFDYVFGDQPGYLPYWASGWSARSLGRAHVQDYVLQRLIDVDRRAQIFLCFGMQDLIFSLPARLKAEGLCGDDPEAEILAETAVASAILGQVDLMRRLRQQGFSNCTAVFWAPPPALPAAYWLQHGLPPVSAQWVGALYCSIAPRMARHLVSVADFTDTFGPTVLQPAFARSGLDHHPDYIRCQRAFWAALQALDPVLKRRRLWRRRAWPHRRVMIADLIDSGQPRPRTCR